ncbi:hypothetical protein PR048_014523 [Dryococelus australis]|uniref:Uncharacterized protein n=1 Tax=Dryococelus australis TaxID=614101 RepID=A0ABQ9HEV3_9NEOP|nr:hypothetical protein PR048_014523 [Dryococelus australis]
MEQRGKREIPEKTCRQMASSGTIPTCDNPEWPGQGLNPDRFGVGRAQLAVLVGMQIAEVMARLAQHDRGTQIYPEHSHERPAASPSAHKAPPVRGRTRLASPPGGNCFQPRFTQVKLTNR